VKSWSRWILSFEVEERKETFQAKICVGREAESRVGETDDRVTEVIVFSRVIFRIRARERRAGSGIGGGRSWRRRGSRESGVERKTDADEPFEVESQILRVVQAVRGRERLRQPERTKQVFDFLLETKKVSS